MVATTAAPCRPKTFDIAGGDLVLQVCSNARHGQIVRLKAPKCTIGSAAHCTLRLRARGVAPLHCLILRGPGGAAVRRWSPDTLLNHQAFTDAALAPGDRLSVGPVELEVLSSGSGANWVAPAPAVERLPLPQLPDPKVQSEREQLETQRAAVELQRQRWQAERAEAERLLHEQNEELNNRLTALNAQLAELDARAAELDVRRQTFDLEQQQWQTDRTELQRRLNERDDALTVRLADLDARGADLDARIGELATRKATLDADRALFHEERSRWQQQQEQAPVNLGDVPRRVGAKVDLPDEEPVADRPATGAAKPIEPPVKTTPDPPKQAAGGDEEEESVDDYMSRLMDRIRSSAGDSGPSTYTPPKSEPRRPAGNQPSEPAEVVRPQTVAQPQTLIEQREPVEMSPRTAAPESRINLSALRELANLSAHAAIDRHARRTLIRIMYSKLVVAVVALLSGAALLWMWNSIQTGNQTFYSSLAALLIAIFWVLEYAILTGRLFVSKSGHIDWNSSPHREHPSLAAEDDATEEASPTDAGPAAATDPEAAVVDSASHEAAGR